ncbi:MAG: hypothetical protein EPO39_08065 [Candidatus Manganitrophaceae bacterium]|nr:MAG: hypothetical protein EPO39_08065 [Candidatus Manganitrophaceae bacterium]
MRTVFFSSWTVLLTLLSFSTGAAFEVTGLSTPESFIVDEETGNYFISNINGSPIDKDNNGFITKLDPSGKVLQMKFIDSTKGGPLHAPKGMAVVGKILYVTDIDHVKGYDKNSGMLAHDVDLSQFGATFLNDLTHDAKGNLYVSDTFSEFIARIDPSREHRISMVAKGPQLGQPNGLAIHPKTNSLIMVSMGSGKVAEVTPPGALKPLVDQTFKNLDGIDFDSAANLYFSSHTGGQIYKLTLDGKLSLFQENLKTPADIGIDRKNNLLLVPSFQGDRAFTIPLK